MMPVAVAIILLLLLYGFLLYQGIPQNWTASTNAPIEIAEIPSLDDQIQRPPLFMVAPFLGLLLCIAFLPLIPVTEAWWEHNTNKLLVAVGLGSVTLLYYFFGCNFPVEGHFPGHRVVDPAIDGGLAVVKTVLANAILNEFAPFIVLLFSLFVITGGIRISSNSKGTPMSNTAILSIGALLASFIGTTGAAMLLIRVLLEINRRRKYRVHTVILFIFIVCNAGGCLTPLGDPPLFLGYLRGIPFEWTFFALWPAWLFLNALLIGFYFCWDTWFYRRESDDYKQRGRNCRKKLLITGWALNIPLVLGVVASVALLAPNKPFLGWEEYYPPYYLREAVQLGLAALSLLVGSYKIRKRNAFNFWAIGEVAALFFGIFICMQVPLQIINAEGKGMVARAETATGFEREKLLFWTAGSLSLVLDNAPTYVVFFETARTLTPETDEDLAAWNANCRQGFRPVPVGKHGFIDHYLLVAVALGTIFMGGMTYIANGPNFMVKAIADHSGVEMPSFFGYMGYSCVILLPMIVLTMFLFV